MNSKEDRMTKLEAAENMIENKIEQSETIIAPGAHFKGLISCPDQLFVMGSVEGDIDCGGLIIIGDKARIHANIYARKVIIGGEVKGDIKSAEYVEIKPTGRLIGNLDAAKIKLSGGCFFEGKSTMQIENKQTKPDPSASIK
ncbi:MAG: polymer-forming cytoskeletal protein [Deltaproteobacteria bacterium]|nr:polymer-forming cytoskeletal protein [Deltaproteobacteria bacterium]